MKNHKKQALFSSVIALVLCCAMLVGTTLAWFTDSVSSGRNLIQSGNLDVVLEYKTKWSDAWATVDENTKLFKEGALYEPGYTEVVYLRVSNAGNLALKYDLRVNVVGEKTSKNVYGDKFSLKDYLEIGYYVQDEFSSGFNYADILMPTLFGTREQAIASVGTTQLSADSGLVKGNGPVLPGAQTAQVIAVVLTMPTTVGNEANFAVGEEAPYKLVESNGVYSVEKVKVYVAQVGVTKYESLQKAIDACPAGGKVTILRDAKGPGVVINKNITILFNGHTYTITEPVGSAGTETLGFQILKGNKVVLNNGKIEIAEEAADKFAILIQNYADLTVYQMTLDGTNLGRYENYSYVLSVNCGKVTVNGKSVLTAKDGDGNYALDVYDYSSAGYSLPNVTVTSVVKVNGKISAGAKYSTVYYATVEQAKAANPGKNVTVLN